MAADPDGSPVDPAEAELAEAEVRAAAAWTDTHHRRFVEIEPDAARVVLAEYDRRGAEVKRLHTWSGLMSLLDEHYPPDVVDGSSGDPGPRIVALMREVERLRVVAEAARGAIRPGGFPELTDALAALAASGDAPPPADEVAEHFIDANERMGAALVEIGMALGLPRPTAQHHWGAPEILARADALAGEVERLRAASGGTATTARVGRCGATIPRWRGKRLADLPSCTLPAGHAGFHHDDDRGTDWGQMWTDGGHEVTQTSVPLGRPAPTDDTIPVAALRALAQGEPPDEVADDYGVDPALVEAVLPLVGRTREFDFFEESATRRPPGFAP